MRRRAIFTGIQVGGVGGYQFPFARCQRGSSRVMEQGLDEVIQRRCCCGAVHEQAADLGITSRQSDMRHGECFYEGKEIYKTVNGTRILNTDPTFFLEVTVILPPIPSMISFTVARPIPVPLFPNRSVLSRVCLSSKILFKCFFSIPEPLSAMLKQ